MPLPHLPSKVKRRDIFGPTQKQPILTNTVEKHVQHQQIQENKFAKPINYALSIVIPTRNERENILPLLQQLRKALDGLYVEVIFVDDSDDDTPEVIAYAKRTLSPSTFSICMEHRLPGEARKGGLATAVVHGLNIAQAKYVAVLDADLQHPPAQLRLLYEKAIAQNADLVLASRFTKGGSSQGLDGASRLFISVGMKWTAKLLFPERLLRISDPLGGFFLVHRSLLKNVTLRPIGYKILLEILMRTPWTRVVEVPYQFQMRAHGKSKANTQQGMTALRHMLRIFSEVPEAGRIWKISSMLLLNICFILMVFFVGMMPHIEGNSLSIGAFCTLACLDFLIFNSLLFPAKVVEENEEVSSLSSDTGYNETFKIPAAPNLVPSLPGIKQILYRGQTERGVSTVARVTFTLAILAICFTLPGLPLTIAVLFFGAAVFFTKQEDRKQEITALLAIITTVATIDYLGWRVVVTNWHGWWLSVPLLFAEILGGLHALGFQLTIWPRSPQKPELGRDPTELPIYMLIPTVNEGASVLRPTILGAIAARDKYMDRYPHGQVAIVICNDGYAAKAPNWYEAVQLAQELGVMCITRRVGGGAKAGNIENARRELRMPDYALMVIFDADQVAKPNFLLKTIPPFRDTKIGWVQTGQYYANLDNPVSRWADDQQSMFYNLLCPGKAAMNASFICGTNVVLRSAALNQIGGLPQNSVTEDFAASIKLHAQWRSLYITDVLVTGMGPLDVPSYLKQQSRWAMGTLGVFRSHWRDILLPKRNGLRIEQRVQYFLACTHYLGGLRDFIYVISPILFLFTGVTAVRNAPLGEYLWHFVPYILLSSFSLWYAARGITGTRGIIIGFGSFPVLIESLLSVLLGRKVGFAVTSKQRSNKRSLGYLWVYVLLLFLCVASLLWGILHGGIQQQTSLVISVMWILYSMLLLGSFLWLSVKDIRFQIAASKFKSETCKMQFYPSKLKKHAQQSSFVLNMFLAILFAVPIFASNMLNLLPIFHNHAAAAFTINSGKVTKPYFGVSLPAQLLKTEPGTLEASLNTRFSIIGRTQDIEHDHFDTDWATQLATDHAIPWITLQFGTFGPDGKPPLDSSLIAIINGLHDQQIRSWAQDIRSYGKPVYLTALLQADRNWSISSGVTNGGVPADVSQAWMHMRAIFSGEGARNVAWVWAMADPLHDQVYAPPPSAIDAVLQDFINYPRSKWADTRNVLHDLVQHYPAKPIIVEASINGSPKQKATWLTTLGKVVDDTPQVYALVYHEGGPVLSYSQELIKAWSCTSDDYSLTAMRQVVTDLQTQAVARSY